MVTHLIFGLAINWEKKIMFYIINDQSNKAFDIIVSPRVFKIEL